jgi:hypothetical protein
MALSSAAKLQGIVAIGIAIGVVLAAICELARFAECASRRNRDGSPGTAHDFDLDLNWAYPLLILVGGLAGFFVVPMNALLQHRGRLLMSAGRSIAVQNFNENLSVLLMLGLYSLLIQANSSSRYRDLAVWVVYRQRR